MRVLKYTYIEAARARDWESNNPCRAEAGREGGREEATDAKSTSAVLCRLDLSTVRRADISENPDIPREKTG